MKRTALKRATPFKPSARRMKSSQPKMTPARKSAKGQDCTLKFPGCQPGPENENVVLCHLRMLGGGGMGYKPPDHEAVYGCTSCHNLLDGRDRLIPELAHEFTFERILFAWAKTLRVQRASGVLIYKGEST